MAASSRQKVVVVGAGPVGSLAALYAASRGDEVEVYELRGGTLQLLTPSIYALEISEADEDEISAKAANMHALVVGIEAPTLSDLYDTHIPQGPCFSDGVDCA